METKQTAVEWLIDQLEQKGNASVNMSIGRMVISIKENEYIDLIQQAKEIKKQQIIDAYQNGGIDGQTFALTRRINFENGEQYYNEIFEK
jgi:hypothetical protein